MRPAARRAPGVRLMLILGLAAPPAPALATAATSRVVAEPSPEDIERARELYENGVALFDEGAYEGAALAFERAYELSSDSNLLYNIALAYDRNGDFVRAIEVLDRYRALAPESERANLERRKQSLQRRLKKQQQEQAQAEAEAEAEADRRSVAEDEDAPAEAASDASGPAEADPGDQMPSDADLTVVEPTPRRFPVAGWILAGTAVAGLGVGIGFGVGALRDNRQGEQGCSATGEAQLCRSSSGELLRRGRTRALIADVSFGVGAAAAVGVVIVAITARGRATQTSLAPLLTPDGGGITMRRRF